MDDDWIVTVFVVIDDVMGALAHWLGLCLELLGDLFARGAAFLIDSLPVPVCRRARAAAASCAGRPTAATARPSARSSSAGACTWSAPWRGCQWPTPGGPPPGTT